MHTTEAFLAVADVTGNEEYRERAGRIIDHVSDGQPTITGVFLSISPPIGSRISNATMTSRMTSSSRTAPLRAMASSGHVSSPSMR